MRADLHSAGRITKRSSVPTAVSEKHWRASAWMPPSRKRSWKRYIEASESSKQRNTALEETPKGVFSSFGGKMLTFIMQKGGRNEETAEIQTNEVHGEDIPL